ncbi:amidase [Limibaculum sp. M0105]|uniref:Amidase n=1 Tax=Thermohalobaculum xanthum TaxID=2753746 RepID=A0A8J7M631_9RHOB|nr:amidase [Thermohalobaculum xanthum]MBK0398875.1 amidase [Thermohalobaculum xanthum]
MADVPRHAGRGADPADLTARAAARAIAAGDLTAVAMTAACLARIDAVDAGIGAWAHVDRDGAMAAAEALDAHRRKGLPCGPLHGVPVGVKDIIDVAGMPGENGSSADAGRHPKQDATVVRRLRRAGAIILGKTVTTPLAQGAPAAATRNPHDPSRSPGGSSAGSAAAVAAGMVPIALGTQTNGSVIRPASFCGAVGFKPSFGSIPRSGILPVAPSLDHVGLIGRTVEDMSCVELLTGEDGLDHDCRGFFGPLAAVAASRPPVRPALCCIIGPAELDPSTREAFAELCEALGPVDMIPLPELFAEVFRWTRMLMAAEGAHHLGGYLERMPDMDPGLQALIAEGRATPAPDYLMARRMRGSLAAGLAEILTRYDAILTPSAPGEAPAHGSTGDAAFCTLWSYTGLPSITLPLLSGPAGLPLGVQVVGAAGDDGRLLRTANWIVETLSDTGGPE